MNFWMHLKSISETPILIESAVTPGPSVFDTTAGPLDGVVLEPPPEGETDLLLLPHAAPTSAIVTAKATINRRPFI